MVPAPYARILFDGYDTRAQVVVLCPWPDLPAANLTVVGPIGWQCCPDGPKGVITAVTVHAPIAATDPAFTVTVALSDDGISHFLGKHDFYPA